VTAPTVVVQGSSRAWPGGQDLCMMPVDGQPVIYWTIKRILETIPDCRLVVAAPEFDRGGELEFLIDTFGADKVSIIYAHDASPLDRLLEVARDMADDEHIIRADALHFCSDIECSLKMLKTARERSLDCMKFPDDFPVHFASEIYRVGALRKLSAALTDDQNAVYRVHPKFYMFLHKDQFQCEYLSDLPTYSDDHLRACRKVGEQIYACPRQEVTGNKIWTGDLLSYHYEIASGFIPSDAKVLDIACGSGFGARIIAEKAAEVYGADLDTDTVLAAREVGGPPNLSFVEEDVTNMTFADDTFDAVTSMETFEHVDPDGYLAEIRRVLKPGGKLILSTPQNRMGRIPVNFAHIREYSLDETVDYCQRYFEVTKVIGIKAGRVIVPDDPIGANLMVVCTKKT
jgi:SAM-dependent methyltransferase